MTIKQRILKYWLPIVLVIYALIVAGYLKFHDPRTIVPINSAQSVRYEDVLTLEDNFLTLMFIACAAFPALLGLVFFLYVFFADNLEIRPIIFCLVFFGAGGIGLCLTLGVAIGAGFSDTVEHVGSVDFQGSKYNLALQSSFNDAPCTSEDGCDFKAYYICTCDLANSNCYCRFIAGGRDWENGGTFLDAEFQVNENTLELIVGEEIYQIVSKNAQK